MASDMAEAIRQLIQDKGIPQDAVLDSIEATLKAAYKSTYGTDTNAVVKFEDDLSDVSIYSRKVIVDGVYDPVVEIELEDALQLSPECELGDEIDILVDPRDFDRSAVQTGKQKARQSLSEVQKDSLYTEYKEKIGEIIIGYYQRERNGNIFVDLGKVEGLLPSKYQSPREIYHKSDRIKALVKDIKKTNAGLQLILSRTDPDFVRAIVELEVPEVYDKTVEIFKIVREPGYRTKIAVLSHREEVDPVGACVGLKGVRIQAIIRELEGEKIDILKYDPDPREFIRNALSPAEVTDVLILDEDKKQALAVVPETQFSLAIGKQGLNVRLANRLADWSIDVKTEKQFEEFDAQSYGFRKAAQELFADSDGIDEITTLSELPGADSRVVEILKAHNIEDIEQFVTAYDSGAIAEIDGISAEDADALDKLVAEHVEFVDDAQASGEDEAGVSEEDMEEVYECPDCGAPITIDMTVCPNCGIGLSFEEYEDEE